MNILHLLKPLLIAGFLFVIMPVVARAQLTLTGEYRPRTEFRNGYKILRTSDDEPAFFISQRTRLNLLYQQDQYSFKISGQDVRTWGEVNQLDNTPTVNIHEAWAKLKMSGFLQLKLGRQELVYDDARLLGNVNWAQQARSHDALLLQLRNPSSDFKIDMGAAYNQETQKLLNNTYTLPNYKILSYLWAKKDFGSINTSALFITDGFEIPQGSVNYRYTYGANINYMSAPLNLTGTLYLQNGDDASRKNIAAWMAAGQVSYSLNPITITAGYDYISGGDANDSNPTRHTFSTLYATNHKFYGYMDYFTNILLDTHGGGLQDLYLKVGYEPIKNTNINLTYHHFGLSGQISNPLNTDQKLDQNLASEIDLMATHTFSKVIKLQTGYSIFLEKNSLEALQGRQADGLQQWGWVMLILSPTMIN